MSRDLLATRRGRLLTFSLLYISEGIPLGLTLTTMGTYMRQEGVSLAEIGLFTGALYAPWGFKWAWAPLIDLIRPQRFGPHRTWIVASQTMMIATLALLLSFDFTTRISLLIFLMVVHNVFAATQDVAIDALAVRVLEPEALGTANGFMFAAAFAGQAIGGGAALYASGLFGFRAAFVLTLVILILLLVFVSMRLREPPDDVEALYDPIVGRPSPGELGRLFAARTGGFLREVFVGFFRSGRGPMLGVLLALLPKGAVALGLTVGVTLRVDLGMVESQIALLSIATAVAGALGCVAGGWISDRVGHRKALAVWFGLTMVPNFFLASRFDGPGVAGVTIAAFAVANVFAAMTNGLQYGTSNAVFMSLTDKAVAATQFTGYMALSNLANTYSSWWQGQAAGSLGYARTLQLDGLIALVPILLLPLLVAPRRRS